MASNEAAVPPPPPPPGDDTPSWGWEAWYTTVCVVIAFVLMLFDYAKPDMALLGALALILATTKIITVAEGLEGFSNQGLLTVGVLFAVAAGINNTGGLDYYMQRILGAPKTAAAAQFRLMAPVAVVSAFLNNTPVVAILIPIVQQWAARIKLAPGQLFIPLSFASILGGTCTLIGTSTNLVVSGLYEERFPDQPAIGIFDLSPFGVPVMFSGLAYILLVSPWLLAGGARRKHDEAAQAAAGPRGATGELVVAARVRPSSPAVGRTVAEGGLRGLPGLYLVSARRGDMLVRALGPEFVVNEGDVLHFTGMAEKLGEVAAAYGLEPLHHEHDHDVSEDPSAAVEGADADGGADAEGGASTSGAATASAMRFGGRSGFIRGAANDLDLHLPKLPEHLPNELPQELRIKKNLFDRIQLRPGQPLLRDAQGPTDLTALRASSDIGVVGLEGSDTQERALEERLFGARQASFALPSGRYARSEGGMSFTRAPDGYSVLSEEEEERALTAPIAAGGEYAGTPAVAPHPSLPPPGLRMARAAVRPDSHLIGRTPREVGFRRRYGAAIIAIARRGEQLHGQIGQTELERGDIIIMQVSANSALLELIAGNVPEDDAAASDAASSVALPSRWAFSRIASSFVTPAAPAVTSDASTSSDAVDGTRQAQNGGASGVELSSVTIDAPADSQTDDSAAATQAAQGSQDAASGDGSAPSTATLAANVDEPASLRECHRDLEIVQGSRSSEIEFMIAMRVARGSPIVGKTVQEAGLRGLPGLFLASIERHPEAEAEAEGEANDGGVNGTETTGGDPPPADAATNGHGVDVEAPPPSPSVSVPLVDEGGVAPTTSEPSIVVADRDDKLRVGDILWFSGELASVAALRRVPGLVPLEDDQTSKLKMAKAERRLVQAVLAQHSELVGHTAKDARFRTRYDAVIIAVHRAGERVHEQIGAIRFRPGDVLLLDTGPSFMRSHGKDPAFALVSEIRNSMPPRFHLLYVASAAAITMIALAVANVLPLFTSALLAAGFMIITGCLTQQQARDSVNWQVIVTIASAFGLSNALENSGVAGNLAKWLVDAADATGTGETGLLVAIYVGTIVLANIVGNNAAAALMFPVAADAATNAGTDVLNMSFNVMLAASASFASPFGYQTNLMVYGAGGYRFWDFIRFGGPMQLWQLVVSIVVIVLGTPSVFIVWAVSGGFVLAIVFGASVAKRCGRCCTYSRGGDAPGARAPCLALPRWLTCGLCCSGENRRARHGLVESTGPTSGALSEEGQRGDAVDSASSSGNRASSGGRRRFQLFGGRGQHAGASSD